MTKPVQTCHAPGITVTFDPERCSHSANCVRGLPAVFNASERPWIRLEQANPDAIAAQVAKCPSGALQVVPTPD